MFVNFCIKGRLGNAIFRYMASIIVCMCYNGTYTINHRQHTKCNDKMFLDIINHLINKNQILILNKNVTGINMSCYYQHDKIYKLFKQQIINFIRKNPTHYVLTDGVNAGDNNVEKFYMKDILITPTDFNKRYKNVLHIRLEDFVTHNLYLKAERICALLDKNILTDTVCIVCKKTVTQFETSYIDEVIQHAKNKNLNVFLEHNDTITDFYIMKEADVLICSKSTLSWCAAFFSDKIQKCYLPDYTETPNSTCKAPIDNTELY